MSQSIVQVGHADPTDLFGQCRRRVGHLFQGRYKAILVDRDSYLLELIRYIHLNPVRAGKVVDPAEYVWSGHRAYLGEETLDWLTADWVLAQFGPDVSVARRVFEEFVRDEINGNHDKRFHAGETDTRILGSDRFVERVLGSEIPREVAPPTLDGVERVVCRAYGLSPQQLEASGPSRQPSQARALVALVATETGAASLTEVARRFNRDVSTLSTGVRRLRQRIQSADDPGQTALWWNPISQFDIKS